MPTFSSALKTQLHAASTKLDWANILQTALGASRRLRCFHDANPNAADPVATGIEFLNVGSTGALTIGSGNITGFGVLSGVTKRVDADLSSGAAVLRVEGNGHWIQGTLGLAGATTDFVMTANMAAGVGISFKKGAGLKAPTLLDSGTGPRSPTASANKPYDVLIEDWSSGSAVAAGVIPLDVLLPNMVFDDAEMQASMGDVKTYETSTSLVLGNMEFGAVMAGIHKGANAIDATEPVYEVLILRKPVSSNWPGYPALSGWSASTTDTIGDKPFKARIRRQDGTVLFTHEMHDGKPINDPSLNQLEANIATSPVRPFFHCAGALPWRSHRARMHLSAKKYYPGMGDLRPLRGSVVHDISAANGASLYFSGGQQNGLLNWYMLPKWPQATGSGVPADYPTADPYSGENFNNHYSWAARYTGWGYEPGSVSGHDQFCAAGGVRFDRAVMPVWYTLYMHDQNWRRPRNNDSIVEMKEAAEFGFYNLPNFFVTDVRTGEGVPVAEVFNNQWAHCRTYYGGLDSYTAGGTAYAIPQFGNAATRDKNGNLVWGGASMDSLHNYWAAHWSVIFDNSAIGVLASKHRLFSSIMAQMSDVSDTKNPSGWFLVRTHAWRWLHLVAGWKIGTDHKWGVPRSLIEKRLENELNAIYTHIVKPTLIDGSTSNFHTALRNLGNPVYPDSNSTVQNTTSMTFYMGHVLQLMKTFGLWDVMRARSATCKAALDFIIRCLDLMAIDYILDTTGYLWGTNQYDSLAKADGQIASSWADYRANVRPQQKQEDWIRDLDGKLVGPHYSTEPLRYQYACLRRDWITEADVPCARNNGIALAIAKYENYLQAKDAAVAAATTNFDKMAADFQNYYPMYAPIKPATN